MQVKNHKRRSKGSEPDLVGMHVTIGRFVWRRGRVRRQLKRGPNARAYRDEAMTPASAADLNELEMFKVTEAARGAADKAKRKLAPV